ncbi:MAG: ELM1/GtrOC1 family putative glycosyltransferase [Wohlfahrtiimonas sp.]
MKKIIYCITDGKIGHFRQSEGLAKALQQLKPNEYDIQTLSKFSLWQLLKSFGGCAEKIQSKSVVIGAGHRAHFSLLYCKWKYRSKSIVIMKPSLPKSWFDYCIVPRHDGLLEQGNVLVTEGAMNALSLMSVNKENQILILIGGPSSACEWQDEDIYEKLLQKLQFVDINTKIILSTSRRTSADFIRKLPQNILDKVELIDFKDIDASWLPEQLLKSKEAWVTSESISMIYEALSAGCLVKTIDVIGLKGKIAQNLEHVVSDNKVNGSSTYFERLNESHRIAQQLLKLGL